MPTLKTAIEQDTAIQQAHRDRLAVDRAINSAVDILGIEYEGVARSAHISPVIRVLDVAISLVGLALSTPMMLLVALAVKLDSRGPVFFVQERLGLHKKMFGIMKLRTMRVDAELNGPVWAEENDPRITRVGRILRKTRVDELPQLLNVLRGEMSLVGPRPEREHFAEKLAQIDERYDQRFFVKPGLTGWAQISWTHSSSGKEQIQKLSYDLRYLDGFTVGDYIKIILLTPFTVMKCNGV